MKTDGLVIVISAPSGAGKTTLCKELIKKKPNLKFSISATTRPARKGEKNGLDYYFITKNKFFKMVRAGQFAEWARVHDHYYGTPKKLVQKCISGGRDILLDIDVQGGVNIKKKFPCAVLVFVMTPSMKALEQRLRKRKKDAEQVIQKRLKNARKELGYLPKYCYLIINDRLTKAVEQLEKIVEAEHLKLANLNDVKFI
jgi:guanylate kinase